MDNNNTTCCPEFHPSKWEEKTFQWDKKLFVKESVPTFFHIPFPPTIGRKMKSMCDLAGQAGANMPDMSDALVLFHDPSLFKSEIFYSVTKEVPGAENTSLSGEFIAKVFEGPYNSVPKHLKVMGAFLDKQGKKAKDYYVHYAYCPRCVEKFGHNYMIVFAEV
ncbi:hypothetical protein KC865_01170 [Candidatus Kaiserbacteria bacterium]|nr:hypothetical protein [Candidatus Kaiserbacteria bacterium]USN92293.1 MAG: hypothetical protein H6782_00530 [Candidatus Nomurabacteria bacterium]